MDIGKKRIEEKNKYCSLKGLDDEFISPDIHPGGEVDPDTTVLGYGLNHN